MSRMGQEIVRDMERRDDTPDDVDADYENWRASLPEDDWREDR